MPFPLNIDPQQILLHWMNLAILTGGLYFLLYKPVKQFMDKRTAHYQELENQAADKLAQAGGLSPQVIEPVMKTAGIAIVSRLAADFCKDAQEGGLASAVELAGTALALAAALPLVSMVLDLLVQLL